MALIKIEGKANIQGKTKFDTGYSVSDANAAAYIAAVEAADGATLEDPVKQAIENFIVGCKSDGIWTALKASCILAGARTLNGALIPLVGTAPTNFNFVSADYNRKTGLKGSATKYLNTNRNNNADPQNDNHIAVSVSEVGTLISLSTLAGADLAGVTHIGQQGVRSRNSSSYSVSMRLGFNGISRSIPESFVHRNNSSSTTRNIVSQTPYNSEITLNRAGTSYGTHRTTFYSIGESLDLALLDTRVSALMTALNTAI